jgi:hypothetical protein
MVLVGQVLWELAAPVPRRWRRGDPCLMLCCMLSYPTLGTVYIYDLAMAYLASFFSLLFFPTGWEPVPADILSGMSSCFLGYSVLFYSY